MKYDIRSTRDATKTYTVEAHDAGKWWSCTCPHYVYRLRTQKGRCKHIESVIAHNKTQERLQSEAAEAFEIGSGIDWEEPSKPDAEDDNVSVAPAS